MNVVIRSAVPSVISYLSTTQLKDPAGLGLHQGHLHGDKLFFQRMTGWIWARSVIDAGDHTCDEVVQLMEKVEHDVESSGFCAKEFVFTDMFLFWSNMMYA